MFFVLLSIKRYNSIEKLRKGTNLLLKVTEEDSGKIVG